MQLVHQFNTIPFDVRKKYRLHAVLNVHNIKFQQRGQFLAVHPELRPVILWHPVHSQINVTVGPVVAPGTGAKQHKPLCSKPPGQCRKLIIKFFHLLTCHKSLLCDFFLFRMISEINSNGNSFFNFSKAALLLYLASKDYP